MNEIRRIFVSLVMMPLTAAASWLRGGRNPVDASEPQEVKSGGCGCGSCACEARRGAEEQGV